MLILAGNLPLSLPGQLFTAALAMLLTGYLIRRIHGGPLTIESIALAAGVCGGVVIALHLLSIDHWGSFSGGSLSALAGIVCSAVLRPVEYRQTEAAKSDGRWRQRAAVSGIGLLAGPVLGLALGWILAANAHPLDRESTLYTWLLIGAWAGLTAAITLVVVTIPWQWQRAPRDLTDGEG